MPFVKGQSGNSKGRPPKAGRHKPTLDKGSVREAWQEVARADPRLIRDVIERGLTSHRALGYLELGAKLMKEVGAQDEQAAKITIVFNSTLDANKLKGEIIDAVSTEPLALNA